MQTGLAQFKSNDLNNLFKSILITI